MLKSLHVKNLALIEELEVDFSTGLNILTGETGAGKSIILGSINLALGERANKDSIRTGCEWALVELSFQLNEQQQKALQEMNLPFDEEILLQRKITAQKSICRMNGETVSQGMLKDAAGILLDIYGQHEHQTLLKPSTYVDMLDHFSGSECTLLKEKIKLLLADLKQKKSEFEENNKDESTRRREMELLEFELSEIENASIKEGEDAELEEKYQFYRNARKIEEVLGGVSYITGSSEDGSVGLLLAQAVRQIKGISLLNQEISQMESQLSEIEDLVDDLNRSVRSYLDDLNFDEEEYRIVEERLNLLNHLKDKYGFSLEEVLKSAAHKEQELEKLTNHEAYMQKLAEEMEAAEQKIREICGELSRLRQRNAPLLSEQLRKAMLELNFADVMFEIQVTPEKEITSNGYDHIEFMISTNPGEQMHPMYQVASGGELSRIMLAFKSIFADMEGTDTLLFDEIDTGISGKTAWMVAEKLGKLSRNHQLICITHLPQIAAMADCHYLIEKGVSEGRSITRIETLSEKGSLEELLRLLGGEDSSEAAMKHASELRERAKAVKREG